MRLLELSENNKTEYNAFIAAQPGGTFLQAWEWGEWQRQLGNEPRRFCLADGNGQWLAAWQSLTMPLPFGKQYFYLPYGPVIGLRFQIEDLRFIVGELQKKFPKAVFMRIEPTVKILGLESLARKTTNIQPAITMVVDLAGEPERWLLVMHPKTRYNIKVAERSGVVVEHELVATPQHGLYVQEAVEMIIATQLRQHYRGHTGDYYEQLIDFFSVKHSGGAVGLHIYRALYQRELLACGIMVDFGKTRMYLFGGSSDTQRNVMAPYALHWRAMQDAKAQGLLYYDLGGSEVASGDEKGFTRFKRGFGGQVVTYAGAYDISSRKAWYHGYRVLRRVNRTWLRLKASYH